jgi:hypothetical protein
MWGSRTGHGYASVATASDVCPVSFSGAERKAVSSVTGSAREKRQDVTPSPCSAGAVMIVSFGGMMFSTMVPLIEIGFIMGFAILIDATVFRILWSPP